MEKNIIDLHMHTLYSDDGEFSPEELVEGVADLLFVHGEQEEVEYSYQLSHRLPQQIKGDMGHLRQKLEADGTRPRHLLTETGVGYRFMP